jgi:nitrous oxide reductase accessory protein NosL
MKKLIAISAIVFLAASCEEKKQTETTTPAPSEAAADTRAKEISDSTKMLDEKLADPNDPHTPDSIK